MGMNNSENLEHALTWFVALQDEACDEDLHRRFRIWLAQDEANLQAYEQAQRLWGQLDGLKQAQSRMRVSRRKRSQPSMTQFGCVLLLIAGLSSALWQDYSVQPLEWQTAAGEQRVIELADGTKIQMNGASRLSAKVTWWRREVNLLQGQALFDVHHQSFPCFTVQVHATQIRDIGTRFDVQILADETQVSVLEGEVELVSRSAWQGQQIIAGFGSRFDKNGIVKPIKALNPEQAVAWTQGRMILNRTPLSEVVDALQCQHNLNFVFTDRDIARQTVSGNFNSTELKPFLSALEKILPIEVRQQRQTVFLSARH